MQNHSGSVGMMYAEQLPVRLGHHICEGQQTAPHLTQTSSTSSVTQHPSACTPGRQLLAVGCFKPKSVEEAGARHTRQQPASLPHLLCQPRWCLDGCWRHCSLALRLGPGCCRAAVCPAPTHTSHCVWHSSAALHAGLPDSSRYSSAAAQCAGAVCQPACGRIC